MATVVIQRVDSRTLSKKKVDVVLDGKRAVTVSNGETASFTVATGVHKLNVAVNYFAGKKQVLEVEEGATYYYAVTPSKTYKYSVPFLIVLILVSGIPDRVMPFWMHMMLIVLTGLPFIIWRMVIKDEYFNIRRASEGESKAEM